jgi:integrase
MNKQIIASQVINTAMGALAITADEANQAIETIRSAKAVNTIRAHESRLKVFRAWLASRGMQLMDGIPVPAPVVVLFLNDRWNQGKKFATIDADMASIGYWHAEQGIESPSREKAVRDCMAGLKRRTAESIKNGDAARKATCADAAVADIIIRLIRTIDASAANETIRLRDRAMLLLGFAMAARRSEIAALHVNHIDWHPQGIIVHVWASKTGDRTCEISFGDDANLCPISALRAWLDHAGIAEGVVFRQIAITPRGDRRAIIRMDGINGQVVNRTLAKWADAAGLNTGRWTAHSLRAGFCVQGEIDGIPESQLRAQTGHKSAAYHGYAQRAQAFKIRRNASLRA